MSRTCAQRYDRVARTLHWVTVALFAWQFASRLWWRSLPEGAPLAFHLAGLHTIGGLAVFALAAARLAWRLRHPPPPWPESMTRWHRRAAYSVHMLLYLMMLSLPILGLIAVRQPVIAALHGLLAWASLGLIALHVGAALWHHWALRDKVLQRML